MDHYILKPKCKSLLSRTCANCTKFAIDDYSFMYATDAGIVNRGDHWHAIPFPADFHWSHQVTTPFPWEDDDRPILCSYIGSEKSFYGPSRRLRQSIAHFCSLHPQHCLHQSYGLNGTRFSHKVDGHRPLMVARRSVFCFQPTGDLMTRKGLFDALLQGCIPVVFDALTASVMYTWHWEESFWKEISIEMLFHPVAFRQKDPVLYLLDLYTNNRSLVEHKQRLIRSRAFELQYSLDGIEERYQYRSRLPYLTLSPLLAQQNGSGSGSGSSSGAVDQSNEQVHYHYRPNGTMEEERVSHANSSWPLVVDGKGQRRPQRDAYDITMDYILGWHSGELVDQRNATVPECWDGFLNPKANRCQLEKPV
eukprot:scaffold12976_cov188-Ochromonas_danica.AAC.1